MKFIVEINEDDVDNIARINRIKDPAQAVRIALLQGIPDSAWRKKDKIAKVERI
jgi:hypothetical protein